MIFNGLIGFVMMLTVLFCLGDVESVLNTKTDFPFIQVFADSVQNTAGATVMVAVVLILTWCCAIGIITTASRMTWSFARDRGTPFWKFTSSVEPRTQVPVSQPSVLHLQVLINPQIVAVFIVTILAALLTLIYIGSPVAFNDVISLTVTGFYGSYFLPSAFLLYHRLKGHVFTADAAQLSTETNFPPAPSSSEEKTEKTDGPPNPPTTDFGEGIAQAQLIWGPFRIPGILGIINNLYACMYMLFVIFWSVWPPGTPVSAATMNYSVLVTGGVIIFSVVWYWVRGRKEYNGPTVDEEVKAASRGSIVAL